MKVKWLAVVVVSMLASVVVLAHGNKVHVRGTIEKVSGDSLQVKTPDGKSVEIKLTASTVYLLHVAVKPPKPSEANTDKAADNTDKPAKLSDLVAGDLVVIHATPKGGALEADEVKFTVPGEGKSAR